MFDNKSLKRCFSGAEPAEFIAPENWAAALVKLACVLVIGIVLLQGFFVASNISTNSAYYSAYKSVVDNVTNGYTLASLMVMVIGAAAIMHFLGFM